VTAEPAAGDVVAGRYELLGRAGAGGFAVAHEAVDRSTGETVAVKHPNYDSSNSDSVVEQYFEVEADLLARIADAGGHPNIMSLVDRGDEAGLPYLVVEYIDGYELDTAIDKRGALEDPEEVREVGIALCDAMSFLHENEMVYRDLKPDNVMITQRDGVVTPVLIDFNTAVAGEGSETTILGPYKPPEVSDATATDARQGPWSDVYSIGKILLFLLRGAVPRKDGIDPRDFGADCPAYLAAVVERATSSDPEDRYRNATAMRQVLTGRDPSPPPSARLVRRGSGQEYTVYPGDTLGRRDADGPDPSIAIVDEEEYVSTVQVQFELADGTWRLRDRSLNGTYVQTDHGWQRVLCREGRERLEAQGGDPTDDDGFVPPTSYELTDGTLVALVHPSYGVAFDFHR
jgi:protein kinase/serine/threonine-protein kinase